MQQVVANIDAIEPRRLGEMRGIEHAPGIRETVIRTGDGRKHQADNRP